MNAQPTYAEMDAAAAASIRSALPLVRKPHLTWEPGQGPAVFFLGLLNVSEFAFIAWQVMGRHS